MNVTRDIIDNGRKIVHINYTKEEIAATAARFAELKKRIEEMKKAKAAESTEA